VILRDRIDSDYGAVVVARDEVGRFRTVDAVAAKRPSKAKKAKRGKAEPEKAEDGPG
jgi:hypothetical protein